MKIVYMGTPEFAVPPLEQLLTHHEVLAVLTQPDRPSGRGNKLKMSPVKTLALSAGVAVLQPESLLIKKTPKNDAEVEQNKKAKEIREQLSQLGADIFVVAAYGLILPKAVLDMPPLGSVNIHASLLPKYRGAAPIHAAILNGETTTGITIMHMDIGIDTGDMILQREIAIAPYERTPSLHDRMAALGAECIIDALAQLSAGTTNRTPQDNTNPCYVPMIQKTDAEINWSQPTARIVNQTRAFDPWPGPYTTYKGEVMKIWQVEKAECTEDVPPGTILAIDPAKGFLVRTVDGGAWILEMQAPGGKRMPTKDYLRGRNIDIGVTLGT